MRVGKNVFCLLSPHATRFIHQPLTYAANPRSLDPVASRSNYAFERADLCDFSALRAVFARHGIPCDDSPVPFWEPIRQAAAARGLGPDALARLVAELNEAIAGSTSMSDEKGSSQ